MAAYGNPDPKRNIQWAGMSFHRRLKLERRPMRQRYAAHDSAFVNLCTLARLLSEDHLALAYWEAL